MNRAASRKASGQASHKAAKVQRLAAKEAQLESALSAVRTELAKVSVELKVTPSDEHAAICVHEGGNFKGAVRIRFGQKRQVPFLESL
jgi:hypothetical protein